MSKKFQHCKLIESQNILCLSILCHCFSKIIPNWIYYQISSACFCKRKRKSFNSSFFDAPSPTWLSFITYKSSALNNFLSIICVIIFSYSIFNWMSVVSIKPKDTIQITSCRTADYVQIKLKENRSTRFYITFSPDITASDMVVACSSNHVA